MSASKTAMPPTTPALKPGEVKTNEFDLTLFSIAKPFLHSFDACMQGRITHRAVNDPGRLKEIFSKAGSILHRNA